MPVTERRVVLDGLHNFRDLGGVTTADGRRVRTGRVYRSDALHRMTALDVERVRALGLVSVIDLRAPDEVAHVGVGRIPELGVEYRSLPTRPALFAAEPREAPASGAEHYLGYLDEGAGCFGGVVEALADPAGTPSVFFCNAGKDRTGVVAAMVLGLLGVDDEAVAADYARTQAALDAVRAASRNDYPADVRAWRALSPDLAHARAEVMLEFLHLLVTRRGGWRSYLKSLGVGSAVIEAMRDALLESGDLPEESAR